MSSSIMLAAISLCIAIYAAALSTFIALRDLKVKISSSRETEYFEEEGVGGVGETLTVVTVANAGRRQSQLLTSAPCVCFREVDTGSLLVNLRCQSN